MIYTDSLEITFDGLTIKNNALVALIRYNMPIQANQFKENFSFKLLNLGNYLKNNYFKINVPEHAVLSSNNDVYELNRGACVKNFCDINAIKLSFRSRCISNLLQNSTKFCVNIFQERPNCSFIRSKSGHIITSKNGIFFPLTDSTLSATKLVNTTIMTKKAGRLLCQNGNHNSTHILTSVHAQNKFNSSVKMVDLISVGHIKNVSNIKRELSFDMQTSKDLEKLFELDDNLTIGSNNIPTLTVVFVTSFVIFLIGLLCYVLSKKAITHFPRFSIFQNRMRSILGKEKSNTSTTQTEFSLTLINDSKIEQIYPSSEL